MAYGIITASLYIPGNPEEAKEHGDSGEEMRGHKVSK